MTPEQFERAAQLFDRALELDSSQRLSFLNSVCADDLYVQRRVELMLSEQLARNSFLDKPAFGQGFHIAAVAGIDTDRLAGEVAAGGRYQNLVKIAEGGFGVVYRAEQMEPVRRPVALKVLKLGMDTQQILGRFEGERQTLAMMDHPNIATVLDAGITASGRPFFVMELVSGVPITEFCDSSRLDLSARIELFSQVCRAVQHAHQKGIIHRDLKPSNVLVSKLDDGMPRVKVIDFGIARAVERGTAQSLQLTQEGSFLGTPQYMSPEQSAGSGDIDTRTDVYALGVMLYQILVGVTPFDAAALAAAAGVERTPARPSARVSRLYADANAIASQRNTDPMRLARTLRGDLDWILLKCLEHDRSRRYPSADALDADLRRFLRLEPILARPPSRADALRKFVRRNRGGVAAAALVTFAVVAGLIFSLIGFSQARRQRAIAETRNDELRFQLYVSQIERVQRIIETDGSERVKPLLDQTDRSLRGWEWDRLHWLADRSEATISDGNGALVAVDCSTDGRLYLTASTNNAIKLWDANTLREIRHLVIHTPTSADTSASRLTDAKLSPDGNLIAASNDQGDIFIWNLRSGQLLQTLTFPEGPAQRMAFSPDSKYLAACGKGPTCVFNTSTGELVRTLDPRTDKALSVVFSPDGSRILVGLVENLVVVSRADNGSVIYIDRGADFVVRDAKFSPDGARLASLGMDAQLYMRNAADASLLYKIAVGRPDPDRIAFSPDGKLVAVGGADGIITLLDSEDGRKRQSLRGHENRIRDLTFAPGGTDLMSIDEAGTMKRWRLAPGFDDVRYQHINVLSSSAFAENGEVVFCGGVGFGAIRIDLRIKSKTYNELLGIVRSISADTSSRRIAICGGSGPDDYVVMILDENLQLLQKWPAANESQVAISADAQRVLFTAPDKSLAVRNAVTGEITNHSFEGDPTRCAAFAPADQTILSGHDSGRVRVWNTGGADQSWIAHENQPVILISFAAGGRHLITYAGGSELKVWSWPDHELLAAVPTKKITTAAICPDGTRIAAAAEDNLVRLWNVARREQTMTVGRHGSVVTSLTFSPDGSLLASTGCDHILNIWRSKAWTARPSTTSGTSD